MSLLDLLPRHGVALDAVSYTVVLHGLAHRGRWEDALALLDHMTGTTISTTTQDTGTGGSASREKGRSEAGRKSCGPDWGVLAVLFVRVVCLMCVCVCRVFDVCVVCLMCV